MTDSIVCQPLHERGEETVKFEPVEQITGITSIERPPSETASGNLKHKFDDTGQGKDDKHRQTNLQVPEPLEEETTKFISSEVSYCEDTNGVPSKSRSVCEENVLHEARENLLRAVDSIVLCETQLVSLQELSVNPVKKSMLSQLKSVKESLGNVLHELNLKRQDGSSVNMKSEKRVKVENEVLEEDNQDFDSCENSELKPDVRELEGNKENLSFNLGLAVKVEDFSGAEDERSSEETVMTKMKRKRGRPRKDDLYSQTEVQKVKKVQNRPLKKLSCPHCDRVYNSKEGEMRLAIHIQKKHANTFPCTKCDVVFETNIELEKHKSQHRRRKERICPICGATVSSGCLSRHMKFHGEKKFSCEVCGSRFHLKHKLDEHTRTHTGEKPFECEVCGKAFAASRKLSRHRIIHTGERPHTCALCGKGFNQKSNLGTHMKSHLKADRANFGGLGVIKDDPNEDELNELL